MNAVGLVLGLLYGPENATKKYDYIVSRDFMTQAIPAEKVAELHRDFERILEIYEGVEAAQPMGRKKLKNPQWDLGTFTGYIMYSLSFMSRQQHKVTLQDSPPDEQISFEEIFEPNTLEGQDEEWQRVRDGWISYMTKVRRELEQKPTKKLKTILEECLHKGISKARSWTLERWHDGYLRVFAPTEIVDAAEAESASTGSTEDDYESDEDE
jgi:hypothetical protein